MHGITFSITTLNDLYTTPSGFMVEACPLLPLGHVLVKMNDTGNWIIGFNRKIGICSVIESEFWGIYEGLLAAWSLGLSHLIVEVDSSDAINLIRQYKVGEATLALVPHIVSLINRNWAIQLSHVLRKGNVLADCMAKISHWNDLICHRFLLSPESLVSMVEQDSHDSSLEGG
ncbi:hypothetical protein V6N11_016210 [Hibiscus sabdariffa]|uniref:RNase H type-1 domain-containing protein n=1 Tax=Hibiscus sabdariffa TaxID=183260 RepID=A0ABR2TUA2_9ROSI